MKYWFKNVADNIYIYPKSAPRNLILQTRTSDCNSASKSKKILGYTFITDNILPQKSYIDENYKFENQCEKCGRINMTENENIFYFIPKRITEEGINNLKDVNKTYEFYDEYREIVINKKVAQIIKENIPYAKFYPVILDNRN